jgi:hypothetical protein
MAVRVRECEPVAHGCRVTLLADARDAVDYLRRRCDERGWQLGEVRQVEEGRLLVAYLQGPTPEEFRRAMEGNPEFDFSGCQ